jgi:hypothetical protein
VAVQEGQYVANQFNTGEYKKLVDISSDKIAVTQGFRYATGRKSELDSGWIVTYGL